ncbi:MAG: oligoribonuclease [Actinomycetales bacterium]|nr:MAG: oligoribonuclease [Actinomycetales bacterium]
MNELVWIDCEMTGLDIEQDCLIEVACLVTDADLNILGEGVDLIIKPDDEKLAKMSDFVRQMHTSSGLLAELPNGVTMAAAEAKVLEYVKEYVPTARRAPLAGNTVGTDRLFLARDMPELEQWVHYRNVDVSTIKELAKRWYPRAFYNCPEKGGNHRALADIQESIEELRYYQEAVFVPKPGPSTQQAKAVSLRHQGAITGYAKADNAAKAESS